MRRSYLSVDELNTKMWLKSKTAQLTLNEELYDGEVAYNVHMSHLKRINNITVGDLVETTEEQIGVITGIVDKDLQGFHVYRVLLANGEFFYSAIELIKLGEDK